VSCISGCNPAYPSALKGEQGSAVVQLELDSNGNVVDSKLAQSGGSSQLNQEAEKAARKMKFSVPGGKNRYLVPMRITFEFKR
jgi:protein TonB